MGICDSQNNQNQATTNTGSINPVSTSQTVGTASKVVEESVTNPNATATATAEATTTNTQSTGILGNLLGSNTNTNNTQSSGVLGNLLGTNSNTAATNTNTDTMATIGKLVVDNKDTLIDLGKKIVT